jgi:hypothetical protein
VAFNYYALGLGYDKLAGFIALNAGIVLMAGASVSHSPMVTTRDVT